MNINVNNRPSISIPMGDVSADKTIAVLLADKKIRIKNAAVVQEAAIAASGTNYVNFQLEKATVGIGALVDTIAGLAARESLALELGTELLLEVGEVLSLNIDVEGAAVLSDAILVLDYEVIGN